MSATRLEVGGHTIDLTHGERVYFPDAGISKADLVGYYERVAAHMVPHLAGRPLVMQRFPEGITRGGFMHKEAPAHFPDWIRRAPLSKEGGTVTHAVIDSAEALVYVANQGCITPHVWLSRVDRPEHPDVMMFDLDPHGDDPGAVPFAARALKGLLDELGVPAFAKSSGSKGVHVHVPLDRSGDFADARAVSLAVAEELAARHPDRLTTAVRKAGRDGRLFLDTLRNAYAQHAAAVFAVRPRPGAPVAVPLDWEEATSPRFDAGRVTVANVFRRLAHKHDPWRAMGDAAVPVESVRERLRALRGSGDGAS